MEYGAFSDASLKMMYEAVRGALEADDEFQANGEEPRFRVRATVEWKRHADNLESEMLRRGLEIVVIDWTNGRGESPR
ncbi:hypothetical protein JQ633_21405 [Bradyrhizobium tropiciagri]|uniref:hypothetical protein n=1 Tax=Bradyrhizobium tropiciagri TaxID=312253 RepID=UPI001BAB6C73|nr:hypothetical protein [Bradyrhizobium tropiciagri]MBR0872932.1 hypothetical protein [Bradyrhizobium tropiciagri]